MSQKHNASNRRERAQALYKSGVQSYQKIADMLAADGIVNPKTGNPYSVRTIKNDIGASDTVKEIIGRNFTVTVPYGRGMSRYSIDRYRPDYKFWDELRHCRAAGYEVSGLFCQAIAEKLAAYVFGAKPTFSLVENPADENDSINHTNRVIDRFLNRNHSVLLTMLTDLYALGDQFVIVGMDGNIYIPSPDTVAVEHDPFNHRKMTKVTVVTRIPGIEVEDIYTAQRRTLRIRRANGQTEERVYPNLIGVMPVVHFANDVRANELFGRPVYEPMLPLLQNYNDILFKEMDGVKLMGNPIPAFENLDNIEETIRANSVPEGETYIDKDGNEVKRTEIAFDTLGAVFVGKGGAFNFKSPQVGFTEDIRSVLHQLFLLVCTYTHIPEFMWGGAIQSSKASTETQLPPFVRYIDMRRNMFDGDRLRGGMLKLLEIYLRVQRLVDPRIVISDVRSVYPKVAIEDDQIKLQKTIYARGIGALNKQRTLSLLDLVPDPQRAVQEAAQEVPTEVDPEAMKKINQAANQNMDAQAGVNTLNQDPQKLSVAPPDPDGGRNVPAGDRIAGE
jgi:hypothetical protein